MIGCIRPDEIAEGDLMAYVDGVAEPRVKRHVERCASCAAQAEWYARAQGKLLALMYRSSCPSAEILGDYHLDLLSPGERLVVARHLRDCHYCCQELRSYEVSQDETGVGRFLGELKNAVTQVLWAVLPPSQPAFALRGDYQRRQYHADEATLTIEIQPARTGYQRKRLVGHVIWRGEPVGGAAVHLYAEDEELGSEETNEAGYFFLEKLAQGVYTLRVNWREKEIWIADLAVE